MVTSVLDHVLFRLRSITTFHCTFQRHLKLVLNDFQIHAHVLVPYRFVSDIHFH